MSARSYDYIVTVANAANFTVGNTVFGANSNTLAEIIAIEGSNLKLKTSNAKDIFYTGEYVVSKSSCVEAFYDQLVFTSSPIVVDGNTYGIDGSSNTFPIARVANYKDELIVYADGRFIDPSQYSFPSTVLANVGIDFNNQEIITFPYANDQSLVTEAIFPSTNISNLTIVVSRGLVDSLSFIAANTPLDQIETANTTVTNIYPSNYIQNKNAFEEEPVVRLYTIYYPGEWYPPNANDNPTGDGTGYPWPYQFPLRYAEIIGEDFSAEEYYIEYDNKEYRAFPINYPGISISDSGALSEINLELSAIDLSIPNLVDNKYIVGYNNTSAVSATVNGELVNNIDPRTVTGNGSYDSAIVEARGGINLAFDYSSTQALGEEWISMIPDSRDMLGAVVEIKSLYANHLQYWPEYSILNDLVGNTLTVSSSSPFRIGDTIKSNSSSTIGTIGRVYTNNTIQINETTFTGPAIGDKILIVNNVYDKNAYIERKFIITKLNSYNDSAASFTLSNRTESLFRDLPIRKFYRNTCPWKYKGVECKYPSSGSGVIPYSNPEKTANGYFTSNNESTTNSALDRCSKTITACRLRNNLNNWGGFPGVGKEF